MEGLTIKEAQDRLSQFGLADLTLVLDSLFYVFSVRTLKRPLWREGILQNRCLVLACMAGFLIQIMALYTPLFQKILKVSPLGIFEWGVVVAMGIGVIILIEITKFVFVLKSHLA